MSGLLQHIRLIGYMLQQGITPCANLYHYPNIVGRGVANYADFCFKVFQDRVKNWSTVYLQRAEVRCCSGYDNGIHAPGGDSRMELDIVLILSHAVGVHRYPKKYQHLQKGRIRILLDFVWHKPFSSGTTDQAATHRAKDFPLDGSFSPLSMVATQTRWSILKKRLQKVCCDFIYQYKVGMLAV